MSAGGSIGGREAGERLKESGRREGWKEGRRVREKLFLLHAVFLECCVTPTGISMISQGKPQTVYHVTMAMADHKDLPLPLSLRARFTQCDW